MMTYQQAFDNFMNTEFESAVDKSTQAGYSQSGYSVELFDDGSYRVLWNNQIGNLYDSDGVILPIPQLSDDEEGFYDNCEEKMRDIFTEKMQLIRI